MDLLIEGQPVTTLKTIHCTNNGCLIEVIPTAYLLQNLYRTFNGTLVPFRTENKYVPS